MRAEAVAIIVLLLAPAALAQEEGSRAWNQPGGDPQRSRTAVLDRDAALDVLAMGSFLEANEGLGGGQNVMRAVETASGIVVLASGVLITDQSTPCTLIRLSGSISMRAERLSEEPCASARPRLLGAHAAAGLVLVNRAGSRSEVALEALDAGTLAPLWRAAPPPVPAAAPAVSSQNVWSVRAVVEGERIVVAFSSNVGDSILCAFSLAGDALWCHPVSMTSLFAGSELDPVLDPRQIDVPGFEAEELIGIDGGYVLVGEQPSAGTAAIWVDVEGEPLSGYHETLRGSQDQENGAPPVGQGELAAFHSGTNLLVVRASDLTALIVPTTFVPDGNAMVWWRDQLVIPTGDGVDVLRSPEFVDAWRWKASKPELRDLVVTPEGQLLVLTEIDGPTTRELDLSWLDLTREMETRRLPLPSFPAVTLEAVGASLLPLSDGRLFVVTASGTYFVLGETAEDLLPEANVDNPYPRAGETITLDARGTPGATSLRVSWGDGTFNAAEGSLQHAFTTEGLHVVHVTATFRDNTTATRQVMVDVGGTPPIVLTPLQRAFSPEYQEFTLFLLGVALTGGGALFAAVLRRRRQSHLARETRRLHELQDLAARDPVAGLAALDAHRQRLEDAHVRRKLDDAHYAHLDARTIRAMRATRLQLLGATVNDLTPHFRSLLDTALEDGRISPGELATLLASLDDEASLQAAARERLGALLASWAR